MTKRELIEALAKYDDDMEITILVYDDIDTHETSLTSKFEVVEDEMVDFNEKFLVLMEVQ